MTLYEKQEEVNREKLLTRIASNDRSLTELNFAGNKYFGTKPKKDVRAKKFFNALKANQTIKRLNLQHCYLGTKDSELMRALGEALQHNITITDVNIKSNRIYIKQLKPLANALENNKTIKKFDISNNEIKNKGVTLLCVFFERNTSLEEINLADCGIRDKGAENLKKALLANSNITKVSFEKHPVISENLLNEINAILEMNGLIKNASRGNYQAEYKINQLLIEAYSSESDEKDPNINNTVITTSSKRKLNLDSKASPSKKIKIEQSSKRYYNFFKNPASKQKSILEEIVSPDNITKKINNERLAFEGNVKTKNELPSRESLTLLNHQESMKGSSKKAKMYFSADEEEHRLRCGAAGEETTYEMYKDFWLCNKGYTLTKEDDTGFEMSLETESEIKRIKLTWFNKPFWYKKWMNENVVHSTLSPYDIKIDKTRQKLEEIEEQTDRKYPRYIEVKGTTSNGATIAEFTQKEYKWLLEHNQNVWISRVYNAGQTDCKVRRFRIPFGTEILENEDWKAIEGTFTLKI